jgi:thiol-disulfide isomerase/thioredoxin
MIPFLFFVASLVNDVRDLIAKHDLPAAERIVRTQIKAGATPEAAAALSWVARGALAERQWNRAEKLAVETRNLTVGMLRTHKLDRDPWLPTALGASIEVEAQARAAQGNRSEAVVFLQEQIAAYADTSIDERLHKNLNLLSLSGQPAPSLVATEWIGAGPQSLPPLKGHPTLMFFWAHWCVDCKGMARAVGDARKAFGPKGLVVVAPTRRYGYVEGGLDAPPAVEKQYIEKVRQQYYPELAGVPLPLSEANFRRYGASTTPTVVLTDAEGKVRMYHPGALTEPELVAEIRKVIAR